MYTLMIMQRFFIRVLVFLNSHLDPGNSVVLQLQCNAEISGVSLLLSDLGKIFLWLYAEIDAKSF